ncbi:MAG: hypothetical protein WC048_04020 [Rhizobium sp.]
MAWVIGIFCGLIFLAILFRFPLQTIGFAVLVVGGIWLLIDTNAKNNARRYEQARSLVQADQLSLSDLYLSNTYGSWKLTGNAKNNSRHTITQIELLVTLQDCPAPSSCVTVGQNTAREYVSIPPNQMRAINSYVSFPNLPPLDKWTWNYRIQSIAAQ